MEPVHFPWKKLPEFVFETLGGKKPAKKLRKANVKKAAEAAAGESAVEPAAAAAAVSTEAVKADPAAAGADGVVAIPTEEAKGKWTPNGYPYFDLAATVIFQRW